MHFIAEICWLLWRQLPQNIWHLLLAPIELYEETRCWWTMDIIDEPLYLLSILNVFLCTLYALLFHRNYNSYKSFIKRKNLTYSQELWLWASIREREHSLLSLLSAKTCYLNRDFHKLFNKSEILIIFSPQAGLLFWRLAGGRWEGGDYPKYLKNDTGQSEW